MAITKFIIPPDQEGYSFNDGLEVLSVQLDGGASRYRKDILNASFKMSVQWTVGREDYNYIRVFYRSTTLSGSIPFLIDLYVNDPFELTERTVYIVPGTFGLRSVSGHKSVIGCTLEVMPIQLIEEIPGGPIIEASVIEFTDENLASMSVYGLFGESWPEYSSLLDNVINVTFPSIL